MTERRVILCTCILTGCAVCDYSRVQEPTEHHMQSAPPIIAISHHTGAFPAPSPGPGGTPSAIPPQRLTQSAIAAFGDVFPDLVPPPCTWFSYKELPRLTPPDKTPNLCIFHDFGFHYPFCNVSVVSY